VRVCVTGCAGFIGLEVVSQCLDAGIDVEGIDALVPNEHLALQQWRLQQLLERSGFRFHPIDITDPAAVEKVFTADAAQSTVSAAARFDGVIHLAAVSNVAESIEDPFRTYKTNVLGTLSMLNACAVAGVGHFVLASSASVYGGREMSVSNVRTDRKETHPSSELEPVDRMLSPYAASKKAAEDLCKLYQQMYGFDAVVLRYFTPYGPAGRPDMSVLRFIQRISEGEPVHIYGEGNQLRDYCYVGDIARGTLAALKVSGFEIINLGGGNPVTVVDILSHLERLLGKTSRRILMPPPPGDVEISWANIDKARIVLDWTPQISLDEGLRQTIAWDQSQRAQFGNGWMRSVDC